jgi:hypothetical protein
MKRDISPEPADALATRRTDLEPVLGTRILGLLSGQERKLEGVVPREMTLRARLGYVELDLTNARFQPGVTTIDVDAMLGYVQIRFPPGVRVESNGHAVIGYFAFTGGGSPRATGTSDEEPVVHVTGGAFLGFAEGLTIP